MRTGISRLVHRKQSVTEEATGRWLVHSSVEIVAPHRLAPEAKCSGVSDLLDLFR
jgi:hypothetical protein